MVVHRLKLCFQDFQTPYWIKVPPEITSVGDLMDLIQRKYKLKSRPLLLLKGGVLPEFEDLDLLINEEEVVVEQASAQRQQTVESTNDGIRYAVGNDESLLAELENRKKKLQDEETTPQSTKKPSKSQRRRWRKKKLRKVRSAEPVQSHPSGSSSTDSISSEEKDSQEKERLWASQDEQWNQSYVLQGSKPILGEDNLPSE
ncbi:hypothetical protein Gasu2_47980 [Galdieria sulphuraria]|nr:hypothetical protein Gasu2_47980 [Galdieria sulphuraria]